MINVFLIVFFTVVVLYLRQKFVNSKHLPPGPIRWPIIGSLPQMLMIDRFYAHKQVAGLAKKYGGIFSFGFGVHYAVVTSSFEIMKDLWRRPETNMERPRFDFWEQRSDFKNLGLISGYGNVWKEQRKYTLKLLKQFGFGRKHTMDETLQAEVNDLVNDIKNQVAHSNGIWEVKVKRFSACFINVLWASVGGYRFDPNSSEIERQQDYTQEVFETLGPKNMLAPFPFLKIFPKLSGFRRHYEIHRNLRKFTSGLIADAKRRRKNRSEPESFMEAYLDDIERNKFDPSSNINEDQLTITLMDLFLGGSESISATLYWIVLYLGMHKDVQKKARAEITKYINGQPIPIPTTALNTLPYVNAVILEVLRHSPIAPTTTPRRVTEDIQYEEYTIPAGTILFADFYSVCHDATFWRDPENFRPERLIFDDGKLDPSKVERIVHFGFGARKCPGEEMAMSSLFIAVTGLLRSFSFDVIPGREPSLKPSKPSLTIMPNEYAFQVKII